MYSQYNIGWTLIGDNIAYTSATAVNNIADGEVAAVDAYGTVITTGTAVAGQKFRLVQGRGTGLTARKTDLIDPAGLEYFNGNRHYNPAEQVTDLGWNGTSGSIDAQNSTSYLLRANLIEVERTGFAQQEKLYGAVLTDASATEWEIAKEVAANFNDNTRKRYERDIKAESTFDAGSATASGAITGTDEITVTFDSDLIIQGTDAWTSTPAVGEIIALSSSDLGYEVVEVVNATTVRVHMPYQGASATDVVAVSYTAASVAGVACGLKLTGVARNFDASKPGHYNKVRWETTLENFGNTTVTATTAPADGNGNKEQVAKEEFFAESVFGNRYRKDHLHSATIDTDLSGSTYYGALSFKWGETHTVSGIGNKPVSNKAAKVFVGDGSADSGWSAVGVQAADLLAILNTIFATSATYA